MNIKYFIISKVIYIYIQPFKYLNEVESEWYIEQNYTRVT